MKYSKIILLILFPIYLAGCSAYSLVEPGEKSFGKLRIENPQNWSQHKLGGVTTWTYDGFLLNRVTIDTVKSGRHILKSRLNDENRGFTYKAGASLEDVVELYIDALTTAGLVNTKLTSSQIVNVGDQDAINFEYQYQTEENLTYKNIAMFLKDEDELHRLVCSAPGEHYFPKYESTFRKLIETAKYSK